MKKRGEQKLQELIDKAEFEVSQGTPRDIASRGLWDACADALEKEAELEDANAQINKLTDRVGELESKQRELQEERASLEDKLDEERAKTTKVENELEEARARIAELERAGAPALRERVTYLETGLRRLMLEAHKLRRGVL